MTDWAWVKGRLKEPYGLVVEPVESYGKVHPTLVVLTMQQVVDRIKAGKIRHQQIGVRVMALRLELLRIPIITVTFVPFLPRSIRPECTISLSVAGRRFARRNLL